MQEAFDSERVRRELDRILASDEFSTQESLAEEGLDWILRRLGGAELSAASRILFWVFATLVVVLLSILTWKLVRIALGARERSAGASAAPSLSVRDRVRDLRLQARAALRDEDERRALRLLLFALVIGLGERGDLRFRDSWTNREILWRGHPRPEVRATLELVVGEMEAKEYGGEPVSRADVERLDALCEHHLGPLEEETVA